MSRLASSKGRLLIRHDQARGVEHATISATELVQINSSNSVNAYPNCARDPRVRVRTPINAFTAVNGGLPGQLIFFQLRETLQPRRLSAAIALILQSIFD